MLIDNAYGHPGALVEIYSKIHVVFMPGNTIPILQSMDKGSFDFQMLLSNKYISYGYSCQR